MNPQNITLSAIISEPTEYIQAVQGENNARVFSFTVLDAAGQAIDMEGCTAAFYVDRFSKGVAQAAASVSGCTVTVTLPSGTCNVPGEWNCWLQIIKPDEYDLRVDNLKLRVQPCDIDSAAESSDEFSLLTQLIISAQHAINTADRASKVANSSADSANLAAQSAKEAAALANLKAGEANGAATEANSAAGTAERAAGAANKAAKEANTAASSSNAAAQSANEAARLANQKAGEANSAATAANSAAGSANSAANEANTAAGAANTAAGSANSAAQSANSSAELAGQKAGEADNAAAAANTAASSATTAAQQARELIEELEQLDVSQMQTDLNSHIANQNNPHSVTASQTGALPTAGGSMSGAIEFEGGGSIQYADSLLKLSNGGNILAVGPDGVTSNGKTIAASEGVTWTPRVEMQGSTQPIRSSSGTAYKVGNIAVITYTITFSQPLSADEALWITGLPYNIPFGHYPLGDYFLDLAVNRINGYMSSDGEGNILVRRMDEPYTYSVMNTAGNHVKDGTIFSGTFVCTVI